MIVATALIVLRTLLVIRLAAPFRRAAPATADFYPDVSVLIAAFNEEKVIGATLRAVLANDHPGAIEVLVVDDGSA
jgi:cellulose synthase/poly-beta-1,6-N-acetylglucosamine synthase-like glycosyltransferase